MIWSDLPEDLVGLQEIAIKLRMQLFPVPIKGLLEPIEDLQQTQVQILSIKEHLLKVLIHPLQERLDLEITVQDLMIN